jgi:hypothetical protein
MTTQTMRRERGFLDTRGVHVKTAARGSGPVRNLLREAGQVLRGAFEAPLRYALSPRADSALQALDPATRRDIGV